MKKKKNNMIILFITIIFIFPIFLGAGTWDTNVTLPPSANFTVSYYSPKFVSLIVVSTT